MSKVLSFRDLLLCEELAHIKNEIELLHTANDDIVEDVLRKVGFDTDYPVLYVPSKHRDMQNKVAVGFMAVGEISLNRNFINSPMCSVEERIVAAGYQDRSRAVEMQRLTGGRVSATILATDDDRIGDENEYAPDLIEPDYEEVAKQIKQLEEIRDAIRGDKYNEAGDLKTFAEYK